MRRHTTGVRVDVRPGSRVSVPGNGAGLRHGASGHFAYGGVGAPPHGYPVVPGDTAVAMGPGVGALGEGESKAAPTSRGGPGAWAGIDDLGDLDDMDAALDFEIDDEGVIRESEAHERARQVAVGGGRGPDAVVDEVAAFATEEEVDDVRAPPALVNKIKEVIASREEYKDRVRKAVRRGKKREELILRLNDEITRLAKQLEEAQMQLETGGGRNLMGMFDSKGKGNKGAQAEEEARRRREDARRQLFSGVDMLGDDDDALEEEIGFGLLKAIVIKLRKWVERNWPLNRDLAVIEARFGSSVASYFQFFRWIIVNNIAVALIAGGFFIKHAQVGSFQWTDRVNVFMPRAIFMSSFVPDEALDYAGMLMIANLMLLGLAVRKWVNEDMRSTAVKAYEGKEGDHKFAKIALNPWDHSLAPSEVQDLKYAMGEQILLALHEKEIAETQKKRSFKQDAILYTRRAVGILLSLGVQASGSAVIILLTVYSGNVAATIAVSLPVLTPFADFIVPAAVSLLNAGQPIILSALSKFEKWDSGGTQVKGLVYRLFFTKMLNMLLQVLTFALLADPYMFSSETFEIPAKELVTVRRSTQKRFRPTVDPNLDDGYICRADQAGAGLFQLVLAEFVISKILAIATPYGMMAVAKARGRPWKKAQHDVAKAMASLLFFTQLVMNAFVWAPFSIPVCALLLIINFKFEAFVLRKYQVKPLRPWSANDAGGFFVKFYLISLAIAMFGSALVLTNKTFPKECSLMNTTITSITRANAAAGDDGVVVVPTYDDPLCERLAEASVVSVNRYDEFVHVGGEFDLFLTTARSTAVPAGGRDVPSCVSQCATLNATDCAARCAAASTVKIGCDAASTYNSTSDILTTGVFPHYCDYACGPFVNLVNGYAAIDGYLKNSSSIVSGAYSAAREPGVLWILALALSVWGCFKWNALSIVQDMNADNDAQMRTLIDGLERQVARQKKQLDVFQQTRNR